MTPILDNDYVHITYNSAHNSLVLTWKRFAKGPDFRGPIAEALAAAKRLNAQGWVSDVRKLGVIDNADAQWIGGDFATELKSSPVRHSAIVLGSSALTKMSVGRVVDSADLDTDSTYVATIEEGLAWVDKQTRKAS